MTSQNNKTICRFAPSPTGLLHVGNIRAAIINFLYAKKTGGDFILRLDDTDTKRVKDEFRDGILEDMKWLGLDCNQTVKQSDRLEKYDQAKEKLIAKGYLYECYETPEELNLQRKSQIAQGIPPIYDRTALNLTDEQKENYKKQGLQPYYRFLLQDKPISWIDKIKGQVKFPGRHFSDPVLIRENNVPTYTFCSVVDDIEMGITDIIRGEDHLTNTAIQIQIIEALDGEIPAFSHLALIKAVGKKISKREGGFDIKSLRENGLEPLSIINLLSQIGSSKSLKIYGTFDELIKSFDLNNFSKSSTTYDLEELTNINHKLLQIIDFELIENHLQKINSGIDKNFWDKVKPNLNLLFEVKDWWKICSEELQYQHQKEDLDFLSLACELLPQNTSSEDSWQEWINNIKQKSDRKGKQLFKPLRLALTGQEHGPELKNLLPLIDRNKIIARLNIAKN